MFRIFDSKYRRVVDDFDTREDAEKRLAELVDADPSVEPHLQVLASGKSGLRPRVLPPEPSQDMFAPLDAE
jgi:hypothetical protein